MENKKQAVELADIFRACGDDFIKNHNLCPDQIKAFDAITKCRTAALGGHSDQCDHCGYIKQSYNSCRNRHCPKCMLTRKVQWVDKLAANLPPVKHFHVVFTIPSCLHPLFTLIKAKRTACCLKPQDRLYCNVLQTLGSSGHRLALLPYCTPGGKRWFTIHIST